MKLEFKKASVRKIAWGSPTRIENNILYVDREELSALLKKDTRIVEWDFDFAAPGDKTRILPIKDAIEPRVKLDGEGYFAGVLGPADTAGNGATFVLDGCAVLTVGSIIGTQEGFVDMSGPASYHTPFSKTHNLVVTANPAKGIEKHLHEEAIRMAGLKTALYLADKCREGKIDSVEVFDKAPAFEETKKFPELPKVAYLKLLITQGLLHDSYIYGVDVKKMLPTFMHPNEMIDGALISGNCVSACDKNTTWHHQNDPVIRELYRQHGKEINFIGVIPTLEDTVLIGKERSAAFNLKLLKEFSIDGVVITEEGCGNPDTDICMNARLCEKAGIKTLIISNEVAGNDGASQGFADSTPEIDAFVSVCNINELIEVPAMDKVIGIPEAVSRLSGGSSESLRPDGSMLVEFQTIIGSTCEIGYNKTGAEWI